MIVDDSVIEKSRKKRRHVSEAVTPNEMTVFHKKIQKQIKASKA